jgi:carboxyl-terminal processing protease
MSLYTKYLIFDYATKFRREHSSIPPAGEFEVTDSIFSDFQNFIAGKNYDYSTKSERALEDLKKNAQQENYFNAIKTEYDALNAQMINDKKGDLKKFKSQIEDLMRVEITGRYYYQKGKVKSSLENDTDLAEAVKTINDAVLYKSILAGTYKQPVIPQEDKEPINPDSDDN